MAKKFYIGSTPITGIQGKSAYQSWLDLGNTGTEGDFISSLKGQKGDTGNSGYSGAAEDLEVVNNDTSGGETAAWSAERGKIVRQDVDKLNNEVGLLIDSEQVLSPNIFDKTTVTPNKYIHKGTGGASTSSGGASASAFIEVPANAVSLYIISSTSYSGNIGWACYSTNAQSGYTHGGTNKLVTLQDGDVYFRCTIPSGQLDTFMVIVGTADDAPSEYMPYGTITSYAIKQDIVPDNSVTSNKILDGAVTKDKFAQNAVVDNLVTTEERFYSMNLIDFSELEEGTYISTTGDISTTTTTTYRATKYIPLDDNKIYYYGMGSYGSTVNGAATYDENYNVVNVFRPGSSGSYTPESNEKFIRMTLTGNYSLYYIVYADENGDNPLSPASGISTGDINYFREQVVRKSSPNIVLSKENMPELLPAASSVGQDGFSKTFDVIEAGDFESFENNEFPRYLKCCHDISFKASLESLGDNDFILFGLYRNSTGGKALKITNTKVYVMRYDDSTNSYITNISYNHGLNISDFIICEVSFNWTGGKVHLISREGVFVQEWSNSEYSYTGNAQVNMGRAFIETSVALSNVKLSQCSDRFRKAVWILGDSYVSMSTARWTFQMINTFGIKNFLLDGYAGAPSNIMELEFERLLKFGTPKYLVWCLGMNDSSAIWLNYAKKIEMLCRDKGITLIYQTIPKSNSNKDEINLYIRNSGYRYIDFVSAVMVEGEWYPDMLDDGTHPTVLGAKVLAGQVLADFPEIAQYSE